MVFTPLRIYCVVNAHGNVATVPCPLINRPILGDLNVQWCKILIFVAPVDMAMLLLTAAFFLAQRALGCIRSSPEL